MVKGDGVQQAGSPDQPVAGVYEQLVTDRVRGDLERLEAAGWKAIDAEVGAESSPCAGPARR